MSVYITTPIYYVNAQPHLGHAYTTIAADTFSRFKRLCGEDVRFQTGTDEHGDKVVAAANKAGLSPTGYADRISGMFRGVWPLLNIEPDNFIRTTNPAHVQTVQDILQMVYDQGDIYFSNYSGLYCQGCERFLLERELVDGNCPDHQTPPALISEQNYFFRMSKYQEWLIDYIHDHPDFISPERYRNEVLSFLKEPLEDLCISRPTSRLTWGIPLPFDDRFVTYVWFDALINYLSGLGFSPSQKNQTSTFVNYWGAAEHVIAKDILKPHAIYWPTMLKAIGLAPFRRLHVHGYWNINHAKMSKSIGNVVRPSELAGEYGADAVRYFVLREMSFGLDASFSTAGLIARQNSDLANDLGNLFSRSLAMIDKFATGTIPRPGDLDDEDRKLTVAAVNMVGEYIGHMNNFAFNQALRAVWHIIGEANKYIVVNAPWVLAKEPAQSQKLATVLYNLAEILRLITLVLQPVMPNTSAKMAAALGIAEREDLRRHGKWGLLPPGNKIKLIPPLFPRLEKKKGEMNKEKTQKTASAGKEKIAAASDPVAETSGLISFDAFKMLDLRVAEIVAAERIKKADRLLKLIVKAPEERTIVAGIAEHYQPEELIGRQVLIVANLKPVKLRGVLSHGMVMAVKDEDRLLLTSVSGPVKPGSKVS